MINIPLADIKSKIKEQSSLSEEDINNKIKKKLTDLSGLISEEGAAHIIANELGIKLVVASGPGEKLQVKNVLAGMKNIEINGKVTRKYELKEFQTEKRSGKLASFMIADETGFIRVVLWNDQTDNFEKLKEGDVVTLQGGYVRDNNGRKEIHLSNNGKMNINPKGISIEAADNTPTSKKLSELQEGDQNVEVLATIVQVFDIRFFEIDPATGRRATERDGKFYAGDKEVPTIDYAYVMNLFIDDGTENIRTVLWKNQIQNLLGLDHEGVLKFKAKPADFEPIKTELLGTIIKVVGRTNKNEAFDRLELVANMIYKDVDPEKEIKKLKQETPAVVPKKVEKPSKFDALKPEPVEEAVMSAENDDDEDDSEIEEETLSIDDLEDLDR
ncbi:MAG: OB-fold nucleic acid binding domain-containing protein [archaeon]